MTNILKELVFYSVIQNQFILILNIKLYSVYSLLLYTNT